MGVEIDGHIPSLQERKRALRAAMRERRRVNNCNSAGRPEKLVDVFLTGVRLFEGACVASYCPIRDEMDTEALNEALREQGCSIALPVIIGRKKPLIFRRYEPGDRLLANPLDIFEPMSAAPGVDPDVILIPLLAFDRKRNRLGYGGGYYDRTIKRLRAKKPLLTIGIAGSFQEVEEIPIGINDVPLDKIVTENEVL
jgi:5-formyltetrahydrofolate cyclo-ligase